MNLTSIPPLTKSQKYPPPHSKDNDLALYGIMLFTCLVTLWSWQYPAIRHEQFSYNFYRATKLGEVYRLLTYGFLHKDKMHLLGNMVYLLIAGSWLCRHTAISNTEFFMFYISAIVYSLLFALYAVHKDLYNRIGINLEGVGASGAVSAVVVASLLLSPNKSFTYTLVPLCYYFYTDYVKLPCVVYRISASVHIGGMLYGLIFAIIFYPRQLSMTKRYAPAQVPNKCK